MFALNSRATAMLASVFGAKPFPSAPRGFGVYSGAEAGPEVPLPREESGLKTGLPKRRSLFAAIDRIAKKPKT